MDRLERQHNADAWLAWHMAACQRSKRLPDLKKMMVLPKAKRTRAQRPETIKGVLDGLVARTGGQLAGQ